MTEIKREFQTEKHSKTNLLHVQQKTHKMFDKMIRLHDNIKKKTDTLRSRRHLYIRQNVYLYFALYAFAVSHNRFFFHSLSLIEFQKIKDNKHIRFKKKKTKKKL